MDLLERKKLFIDWAYKTQIGPKKLDSIKTYANTLEKLPLITNIDIGIPFYSIENAEQFLVVRNKIERMPNYSEFNRGYQHSTISASLGLFQKFIDTNPYKKEAYEWWPTLSEYDPHISKEQWLTFLNDGKTFTPNALLAIASMYDCGGTASCKQLELSYGKTSDFYRSALGTQLGSKIREKLGLPYCVDENGKQYVFPIVFQGRNAIESEVGSYVWKLRPELYDALTEFNILRYLPSKIEVPPMEIKDSVSLISDYIKSRGFSYPNGLIENFYLSLKSKPFVILAGTSGTGKTKLVRLFAEAISAKYKLVSVRPDWADSSDLFGHTNLKGDFVPGAIIGFVKEASEHIDTPYILCLDEMNLARVEYYLSDFLSVIETRRWAGDKSIITDEITLDAASEKAYPALSLPENLYIVGTVNMDETTFPFSKKVLDRANTIEFSHVDLLPDFIDAPDGIKPVTQQNSFLKAEYLVLKTDIATKDREYVAKVCNELQTVNNILQKANAHVGYRVRDEVVFYMLNNRNADLLHTFEEDGICQDPAMDNEIMQKILPRIQGSSVSVKELLCDLFKECAGDYTGITDASVAAQMQGYIVQKPCKWPRSAEKICYMMRRYEEDGFTSYWL